MGTCKNCIDMCPYICMVCQLTYGHMYVIIYIVKDKSNRAEIENQRQQVADHGGETLILLVFNRFLDGF